MDDIGLIEYFECDQRPTFILDLTEAAPEDKPSWRYAFCNSSLRSLTNLRNTVLGIPSICSTLDGQDEKSHAAFRAWSTSFRPLAAPLLGPPQGCVYCGLLWSRTTIRDRWRIISGIEFNEPENASPTKSSPRQRRIRATLKAKEGDAAYDELESQALRRTSIPQSHWTDILPSSRHTIFFEAFDWSATLLGPLEEWHPDLRKITCFLMSDSRPACVLWGPLRVVLYNEAYIPIASEKHPALMGSTWAQGWPEAAYEFGPHFEEAFMTGKATAMVDTIFFLNRHGYLEETFFAWNLTPLYDETGDGQGFYLAVFETTRQSIADRRTRMLISMTIPPSLSSFWVDILQELQSNELDIPLAVIYSVEKGLEVDHSSAISTCAFQAALGIPEGHATIPKRADLDRSEEGFIPLFRYAQTAPSPVVLQQQDGSLPKDLFQGMDWRGYGEASTTVIVFRLSVGAETFGFLLIGLNPRRAYDEDHQQFVQFFERQMSISLTSAVFFDQAKLNEVNLSRQLAIRTREVAESEASFKAFADLVPAGIFNMSPKGEILYANDNWYELTGHPRGLKEEMSGMSVVYPDDIPLMQREWDHLAMPGTSSSFEFRLNTTWYHKPSQKWKNRWVIASSNRQMNEDGSLKSIFGCVTEISHQKQAQEDATERAMLYEQLAVKTQEANESEQRFRQMAELAPCGMYIYNSDGTLLWANDQWYTMTGHSKKPEEHYPLSFYSNILEVDHPEVARVFEKLTVSKKPVQLEYRTKKPWIHHVNGSPVQETAWVLSMAFPVLNEDGSVKNLMGCTADISHLKWAESLQMRSRIQAEEAKKSQEKFMDITSHEMRNPLSAIVQSADDIYSSLTDIRSSLNEQAQIDSILDSVQVITLCALHQGRIINDVLTLSKLDSQMTRVTPDIRQPLTVVKSNLKMFEGELLSLKIDFQFVVEDSYERCNINWIAIDPARITQIFINIMTNAIKFTKARPQRTIIVSVGASIEKPVNKQVDDVEWFPSSNSALKKDPTTEPEWGDGQPIYLTFSVRDTGRGLTIDEKTRLFNRFSQANIRTHVEYGGSGLGLFISRELTELQGGEIGVASVAGVGSTFAFYIKGRRANAPTHLTPVQAHGARDRGRSSVSTMPAEKSDRSSIVQRQSVTTVDVGKSNETKAPLIEVLLVEDNVVNQKVLCKQLVKAGCAVTVANHGGEALAILKKSKLWKANSDSGQDLNIVLMDLEMPTMDGLTCARCIRELQAQGELIRHIPIIAVTANARKEQVEASMAGGMDDVMPKPFRVPELMSKIEKLWAAQ